MSKKKSVNQEEPSPLPNNQPDCWLEVMRDFQEAHMNDCVLSGTPTILLGIMEERRKIGIEKYGTSLQPFNGRNPLTDLFQELLDALVYAKQWELEGGKDARGLQQSLIAWIMVLQQFYMGEDIK